MVFGSVVFNQIVVGLPVSYLSYFLMAWRGFPPLRELPTFHWVCATYLSRRSASTTLTDFCTAACFINTFTSSTTSGQLQSQLPPSTVIPSSTYSAICCRPSSGTNCFDWVLLPKPSPLDMYLSLNFYVRFQGDPSYGTTIEERIKKKLETVNDHGDNVLINEGKLKEENRLAATVHLINDETTVVPRGAYVKRPNGLIEPNQSFQGLPLIESDELKSYLHFRSPTQKWNSNLLTRRDFNYSFDFLDPLDADLPEGQFILDNSRNGYRLATIRSLTWPGYYFYHFINTPEYGSLYVGNGRKNLDVPFMLF